MKLNFRQGLASYQKDNSGNPNFLQASATEKFISLIVSPTPTIATFAHGKSNYLQTFDRTVVNAWGPLIANVDNWLYFDIDLLTAAVTFGISTLTPIYSTYTPPQVDGQHWFDQNTTTMKVWSTVANKWQTKVRVFAGVSQNGSTSLVNPQPIGSQAYINGSFESGYILLDTLLRPLRISDGEFLTNDADIRVKSTASTSGVLATPLNGFIAVQAGENIPVMSAVCFDTDGKVLLANSSDEQVSQHPPVGIVRQSLTVNEVGQLSLAGEIVYDQWDWTGHIGEVLFYDNFGKLTLTRPDGNLAHRIAVITGKNSILIDIDTETLPHTFTPADAGLIINGTAPISAVDSINEIGGRVVTISIAPATSTTPGMMTPELVQKLESAVNDTSAVNESIAALYADKANKNHTHQISDVINLSTELSNRAFVNHTHTMANITGLLEALENKAALLHTHTIPNIVGLQSALNDKANLIHTHAIADVTGLLAALESKAPINHTHSNYLQLSGGTLTGPLELSANPINGAEAANKNYVDLQIQDIRTFITTEIENSTSNLSFPLLAPSSIDAPSYAFVDDVLTGMLFSTLGDKKTLTLKMSDTKKGLNANTLSLYSGGVASAQADVNKFTSSGAGVTFTSSKLSMVGSVTHVETGEVKISTGELTTSPTSLQNTSASVLLGKTLVKDGTVEAGNIVIQTAKPTGDIGGEIEFKFGRSRTVTLKNTGTLVIQGDAGAPGQVLMSQGPNAPLTWQNVVSGGNNLPMVLAEAGTPTQAEPNKHYILVKNAPVTVRLPVNPAAGDSFYITIANTLATNKIELSSVSDIISGVNEPCTLDVLYGTVGLKFVPTIGWVFL